MRLIIKEVKNFWFLKDEMKYLAKLAKYFEVEVDEYDNWISGGVEDFNQDGIKVRPDFTWLIKNAYQIKVAITNMAVVAKKLPKEYNAKVKKEFYFIGNFNKLLRISDEWILGSIAVASGTMAARCMKAYRKTNAPVCKRYYSFFRALEQQANRLDERLDVWTSLGYENA